MNDLLWPFPEVLEQLDIRASDAALRSRVERWLGFDLPSYLRDGPALQLARHVASPNFETLLFMDRVAGLPFRAVVTQDSADRFVPHNPLKKALGKLTVELDDREGEGEGAARPRLARCTIIDFNLANGHPLHAVRTLWGERLIDFHGRLLGSLAGTNLRVEDDAAWISRHHRGDLAAHYRAFLALFVAHGVLFEDYAVDDKHESRFVAEVLQPAYDFVEATFGCRPLITSLTPPAPHDDRHWTAYPAAVLELVPPAAAPRHGS